MRVLAGFEPDANLPLDIATVRESLALRARQSVHSFRAVLIAAVLACIGFSVVAPPWRLLAWALPIVAMAWINARVCTFVLQRVQSASPRELGADVRRLLAMTLANQALLGSTVWWVGGGSDAAATLATTLQLIYLGGALINASTHPPTFIAGAWVNLGMAASYWATDSSVGIPLAFGLLGLGLLVSKFSVQIAADFRESLRMRFENLELLQQLEHEKQLAEQANAAKSRFLAAASHDLRQPLHALLVFSSLLGRSTTDPAALIGPIRDAASALDKLFSGLLDISKLETGAIEPQFQAVDAAAVAHDLAREYAQTCAARGLVLEVDAEQAWALTDPFLLERILRNLLDNAVKYTQSGEVRLEVRARPSAVEMRVSDTGIGIQPEMRERIFEEYFQLDNPARDPERGTGLGLAIVRKLAALLGLHVQVQSEPGAGSSFSFELPKAPILTTAGGTVAAVHGEVPLLGGKRVWLVEDNKLVRGATRQALQAWGCTVEDFEGMPALGPRAATPVQPDALVVDYRLGNGVTGLHVIRAVRAMWPGVPVAVVTGDPALERGEFEALGRVTLMQKPVLPEVLVKWLARETLADADAVARGDVNRFGAALDTQLAEDDREVGLDGSVADAELARDQLVGKAT